MKIVWGIKYEALLKRIRHLELDRAESKTKYLRLREEHSKLEKLFAKAQEDFDSLKAVADKLKAERDELAESNKKFTSPSYRANIRREIERGRISAARKQLEESLPKEMRDKVDWDAVDYENFS